MNSLLKELSRGDFQQDLKSSDKSDAGQSDTTTKPVDVKFSLMRNMINTDGQVSGSDVNDYLERASDLNDEVDTVGFAIETGDGDLIKVYVNATEADEFEQELSNLLGLDDDSEAALNTLAQKYDIVDVVWPQDPDGDGELDSSEDPYAGVSIDDDPSSFIDDAETEGDAEPEGDVEIGDDVDSEGGEIDSLPDALPADDDDELDGESDSEGGSTDVAPSEKPKKKSLMKDVAGDASDEEEEPAADDADTSDAAGPEEIDADPDADNEEKLDDDDADDEEELDADGNPVKKKKAKKGDVEVTEEGLTEGITVKRKGVGYGIFKKALVENLRDDVNAHIARETVARTNKSGKFVIDCLMTGGTLGRRQYQYQEQGKVKYFSSMQEAEDTAKDLSERRNHSMARAHYTFTPRMVEELSTDNKQETEMSIGSKFLERLSEAAAPSSDIKLDTPWTGLRNRMKRPYEKKIVELFSLVGIPGRYVQNEDGLEDAIKAAGDIIRRPGRKQTAFNAFYDSLKTVPVSEGVVSEAKKRGGRLQKILETVLVVLGLPESLVTVDGKGAIATVLSRAAKKIESDATSEAALVMLAKALGITSAQVNEGTDPVSPGPSQARKDASHDWSKGWTDFDLKKDPEGKKLRAYVKSMVGGTDAYLDAYVARTIELASKVSEDTLGSRFLKRLGEEVDVGQDDFSQAVVNLVIALGVPESILAPRRAVLQKSLREKKMSLTNRSLIEQRMAALVQLIEKGTRKPIGSPPNGKPVDNMKEALKEGLLMEAFGPLEAFVGTSLDMFNALEPAAGPAMMAGYEGSGAHEETILVVAVDPDADDDNKSLRVGIDGPFDGSIHAKYFANNRDGYKAAIDYANMLRTCNLKTGGRPKGWKE